MQSCPNRLSASDAHGTSKPPWLLQSSCDPWTEILGVPAKDPSREILWVPLKDMSSLKASWCRDPVHSPGGPCAKILWVAFIDLILWNLSTFQDSLQIFLANRSCKFLNTLGDFHWFPGSSCEVLQILRLLVKRSCGIVQRSCVPKDLWEILGGKKGDLLEILSGPKDSCPEIPLRPQKILCDVFGDP